MSSRFAASVPGARRLLSGLATLSSAFLISALAFAAAAAAATLVTPQQLTVTAANASGDSIYDLTLATGSSGALISAASPLNSDGGKHGSFDALVWSPNAFSGTLDLIVADAAKGQILRYAGPITVTRASFSRTPPRARVRRIRRGWRLTARAICSSSAPVRRSMPRRAMGVGLEQDHRRVGRARAHR